MRDSLKRIISSVGLIVVTAFVVRMAFLYVFYRSYGTPSITNAPLGVFGETGEIARSLASGRGFSSPLQHFRSGPTAWITPIFPLLLAGVFKVFGTFSYTSGLVIHTIDLAFSALTCWPIYAIGKKAFGKTTGKLAAWAWVFCPTGIFFPLMWVWDTALAGLWMALLFAATLYLRDSDRMRDWLGYGAMWAVGAMINASLLATLPFLALWAIWPLRARLGHAARLATVAAVIFAAGLTPWTIRNYVVFHKFIPLRANFGLELWLGNNPAVSGELPSELHPYESAEEGAKYVRMTEIPYMAEKQKEAISYIRQHPLETVQLDFRRFIENWLGMWDSPVDIWAHANATLKLNVAWNIFFAVGSLLGVLFASRTGNAAATPFAWVLVAYPFIFYITHTSLRYRYPIDCIMQILAVYAVVYPVSKLVASLRGVPQELPRDAAQVAD